MKLPLNYQMIIFKFFNQIITVDEFETWLYTDEPLAQWLPENVYLDLISLNFKEKHVVHELDKLLADYLDKGEFLKWQLMQILSKLIKQPNNCVLLEEIYNWYMDGCGFMRFLAEGYGLCGVHNITPQNTAEIQQQATLIFNALQNGEIQLYESNSANIPIDYFDNRNEYDKQKTDAYYIEPEFRQPGRNL